MKKLIFLLVLSLTATSCTLSEDTNNDQNPSKETSELSVVSNEIIDEQNDNILLESAISSKDASLCEGISDTEKKSECKLIVSEILIMDEAVQKEDKVSCDSLTIEQYKNSCSIQIEAKKQQSALDETESLNRDKYKEEMNNIKLQAKDKKDYLLCDKIDDENLMYSCKFDVIKSIVSETGEIELCEKIGKQDMVEICKN